MITPRPYQQEAVQACQATPARRILVALPTGTGKTIIFALLVQQRGGRTLILAHRDELIQQAVEKLFLVDPTLQIGIVKAEADEREAPVIVASVQTLSRERRLQRLPADFSTVVIDEAHHAAAETYQRILGHCRAFDADGPLVVGVTATPERHDKLLLGRTFQEIVYQRSILEMMQAGYLCDLRAVQVLLQANFDTVRHTAGDFEDGALGEALLAANAPRHVLAAWQEHGAQRKTLVFTPTVALAHAMAATFHEAGVAVEALDGTTPLEARRATLRRLTAGETQVLCNCAVLTEGFDEPSLECIIIARPTASRPLYQQMLGRGTRTYPGKTDCLILDVVGASTKHKLQQLSVLFDLPEDALAKEGSVLGAVNAQALRRRPPEREGTLVHSLVDLFTSRSLAWIHTRKGAWVLAMADKGTLRLVPEEAPEQWQVWHTLPTGEQKMLHAGLSLGYAQGGAEDVARQLGAKGLLDPQALWRQETATDKQKEALRKWRIAFPETITKGEAGALLTAVLADLPPRPRPVAESPYCQRAGRCRQSFAWNGACVHCKKPRQPAAAMAVSSL